jgi:hypothetical protein
MASYSKSDIDKIIGTINNPEFYRFVKLSNELRTNKKLLVHPESFYILYFCFQEKIRKNPNYVPLPSRKPAISKSDKNLILHYTKILNLI